MTATDELRPGAAQTARTQVSPLGFTRPVLAIYQGDAGCGSTFHAEPDMQLLRAASVKVACLSRDDVRRALEASSGRAGTATDGQITAQHIRQLRELLASGVAVLFVPDPDRDLGLMTAWTQLATEAGAQLHLSSCCRCTAE